jgi:hypothetical protein
MLSASLLTLPKFFFKVAIEVKPNLHFVTIISFDVKNKTRERI